MREGTLIFSEGIAEAFHSKIEIREKRTIIVEKKLFNGELFHAKGCGKNLNKKSKTNSANDSVEDEAIGIRSHIAVGINKIQQTMAVQGNNPIEIIMIKHAWNSINTKGNQQRIHFCTKGRSSARGPTNSK